MTRIIFAGTPDFAAIALTAIVNAGLEVALVLTQPDRPKGRGMKLQASAVKQVAEQLHLPLAQPASLRDEAVKSLLRAQHADVMVVAAYGLLLPEEVLAIPRRGCLNIHASLLPRWRGAAPIARAIEAGDTQTGVCIMQMDAGLDTGGVISRHIYDIKPDDTAQTVHDALAVLAAQAIVADLQQLDALHATPQPEAGVTYAKKLSKAEAKLDWQQPAAVLQRKIRAFNPVPGAWTVWKNQPLKIWQADVVSGQGRAGTVLRNDGRELVVAAGAEALSLTKVQLAGSKAMPIATFLRGNALPAGSVLGAAEAGA